MQPMRSRLSRARRKRHVAQNNNSKINIHEARRFTPLSRTQRMTPTTSRIHPMPQVHADLSLIQKDQVAF